MNHTDKEQQSLQCNFKPSGLRLHGANDWLVQIKYSAASRWIVVQKVWCYKVIIQWKKQYICQQRLNVSHICKYLKILKHSQDSSTIATSICKPAFAGTSDALLCMTFIIYIWHQHFQWISHKCLWQIITDDIMQYPMINCPKDLWRNIL